MNEAETRAELIDPALREAGWGVVEGSQIYRERRCRISAGRLIGSGKRAKPEIADYILVYNNKKLAVIEAKRRDAPDTECVGQAKSYAQKLQSHFAYSTNGRGIYEIDTRADPTDMDTIIRTDSTGSGQDVCRDKVRNGQSGTKCRGLLNKFASRWLVIAEHGYLENPTCRQSNR